MPLMIRVSVALILRLGFLMAGCRSRWLADDRCMTQLNGVQA
jgi:hypothetical protein